MWALEFQMAALRYPELRESYNRQYRSLKDDVATLITASVETAGRTTLERERLEALAEAFVVLQTGLSAQRILDPDRVPEDIFALAFETLWKGIISGER